MNIYRVSFSFEDGHEVTLYMHDISDLEEISFHMEGCIGVNVEEDKAERIRYENFHRFLKSLYRSGLKPATCDTGWHVLVVPGKPVCIHHPEDYHEFFFTDRHAWNTIKNLFREYGRVPELKNATMFETEIEIDKEISEIALCEVLNGMEFPDADACVVDIQKITNRLGTDVYKVSFLMPEDRTVIDTVEALEDAIYREIYMEIEDDIEFAEFEDAPLYGEGKKGKPSFTYAVFK